MVIRDGRFRLYRHILTPEEPRLAFIGYASTFNNTLTAEVASHWLAQHFRGDRQLPTIADMQQEIDRVLAWIEDYTTRKSGFFLGPINVHYLDDLIEDMGLATKRTSNFLTEYMGVSWPKRYLNLGEERRLARTNTPVKAKFYLRGIHALIGLATITLLLFLL